MALQVTQRGPEECLFIDDREVNLECPRELGIKTILFTDAAQLRAELVGEGVTVSLS
jgi:FMN phosphatase YigB (HAD superfamily)